MADEYWRDLLQKYSERQDVGKLGLKKKDNQEKTTITTTTTHDSVFLQLSTEESASVEKVVNEIGLDSNCGLFLTAWHLLLSNYFNTDETIVGIEVASPPVILPSILSQRNSNGRDILLLDLILGVEEGLDAIKQIGPPKSTSLIKLISNSVSHSFCSTTCRNPFSYPLSIQASSGGAFRIMYNKEVFCKEEVSRLLSTLLYILQQLIQNPRLELSQLRLVTEEEEESLLHAGQKVTLASELTMTSLFEESVSKCPNKIALVSGEKRLTYAELNTKANQLAQQIQSIFQGEIKEETIIPIYFNSQDENMIISILGIWKAGCAYVALDPQYPETRNKKILEQIQHSKLIVTDSSRPCNFCMAFRILDITMCEYESFDPIPPQRSTHLDSISHLVFTSGTTGSPKGIVTLHRGLVNACREYPIRYSDLIPNEVVLCIFNYVFNAFSEPLSLALSRGYTLLLGRSLLLQQSPRALEEYLIQNGVSHVDATPSQVNRLNLSPVTTLRRLAVGGEVFREEDYRRIRAQCPTISIFNIYGISEGCLCVLTSDLSQSYSHLFTRPVLNKSVSIRNRFKQLVPIGALGEFYLGGGDDGLLHVGGYWNAPLSPTFLIYNGKNVFKSGDLGIRYAGGGISYVGRGDFQVKIRGFRIDLGEIEAAMCTLGGIGRTCVLVDGVDEKRAHLVGLYENPTSSSRPVLEEDLRKHLAKQLPTYMLPSRLILVDSFPETPNGKMDRRELKKMLQGALVKENENFENPEESIKHPFFDGIQRIWADVLGIEPEQVGLTTTFDGIGGNSLLGIEIMERVNEELGVDLDFNHIFLHSSVGDFLKNL